MNPVNAKKLSYLRAQAYILGPKACQLTKIDKKLEKSEHWEVKWSSRNDGFQDTKRMGRPKLLNEAAKRILKKAQNVREYSTRQISQLLPSKGHFGHVQFGSKVMVCEILKRNELLGHPVYSYLYSKSNWC